MVYIAIITASIGIESPEISIFLQYLGLSVVMAPKAIAVNYSLRIDS